MRRRLGYVNTALYTSTPISGEAALAQHFKQLIDKGAAPSKQWLAMVTRMAGASESDVIRACHFTANQITENILPTAREMDQANADLHYYLEQLRDWCSQRALGETFDDRVTTFRQLGGVKR